MAQAPTSLPEIPELPEEQQLVPSESTAPPPPPQRGWCGPFCLALMTFILLFLLIFGGLAVLLVNQVIAVPTNIMSFFANPTIVNRSTIVLESIEDLNALMTTRYTYNVVVTSEREMPGLLAALYGDRLAMVAVGYVTAAVDLGGLSDNNVIIDGSTLTLLLPAPRLQDCFLNENESYVIERDTGIFASPLAGLDTEARRYAVGQFAEMAIGAGILNEAQAQAQAALTEFISLLNLQGIEQVVVSVSPPDPAAPLPPSCQ